MAFVQHYFDWIKPATVLANWRQRLGRVAEEETAYFASLPYVRGVAVIGTVGRGTAWPLSDVDGHANGSRLTSGIHATACSRA